MSKSQYRYPPDEFDVRGPDTAPVGVHREPRSGWSTLWPFLLVAVIFAGIAIGAVSLLSDDPSQAQAAPPAADGTATSEASPSAPAEGSPAPSEPAATPAEPAPDIPALVEAADEGAPIRVVNNSEAAGSSVSGLAGKGAQALAEQGFANVTSGNPSSDDLPTVSTVQYVGDRGDTAAAVAAVLGIGQANVTQVDALTDDAEVLAVLAVDF